MIIDLQRRIAEIGRIRIGEQVQASNGKSRPSKLDTFRLTSQDPNRIKQAADLFGGTPRRWASPAGPAFEVVTEATSLDVMVPPSDMAFSQHYELWSAGGCQRRCDGARESISDGPCKCDPENRECAIHTRLSVMLRDLPGLGVWRIDTSGYYAAVELQGAVQVIQIAAGRGQILPARLRLDQRVVKRIGRDGKSETRRFAVPVLDVEISPGQLLAGPGPQLDPVERPAIEGGRRPALEPVPESVPERPVRSVAEQVNERPQRSARSNAAQPIPSSGIAPRTVAEVGADLITPAQSKKLHALLRENELGDRDEALAWLSKVLDAEVSTTRELTKEQASRAIDKLAGEDDQPAGYDAEHPPTDDDLFGGAE